jgi:peroxiredoxin
MMRWFALSLFVLIAGCHSQPGAADQAASADDPRPVASSAEQVQPLGVGQKAPQAAMQTPDGRTVMIDTIYRRMPTVLVFYRGGWCPYCNTQLSDLAQIEGELRRMGLQIVAVSMDKPAALRSTLDKSELGYTLLSDADAQLTRAFGLAFRVDQPTIEKYTTYGIDLEAASGHDHHILPVPAIYLIDAAGTIHFAHWNPDYKARLSGEKVLEAAKQFERNGG